MSRSAHSNGIPSIFAEGFFIFIFILKTNVACPTVFLTTAHGLSVSPTGKSPRQDPQKDPRAR